MVKSYQVRPFLDAGQGSFREIRQGEAQEVGKGRLGAFAFPPAHERW